MATNTLNNDNIGFFSQAWDAIAPKNPVHGRRQFHIIPESLEHTIGALVYRSEVHGGRHGLCYEVCKEFKDASGRPVSFERLVRETGEKIAKTSDRPDLPYLFKVLDIRKENAWCMPGGKIAFYEGLVKAFQNETRDFGVGTFTLEEKIAAVLGHEIVHAAARHSTTAFEFGLIVSAIVTALYEAIALVFSDDEGELSKNLPWPIEFVLDKLHYLAITLITSPGDRAAEFESDKFGMVYLHRAGYRPEAAIWLQEFFASQEISTENKVLDWALSFFETHPDSKERADANRETLKLIQNGTLR